MDKTDNSRGSKSEINLLISVGKSTNCRSGVRNSTTEVNLDKQKRKVIWMSKIEEHAQSGDDQTGLDKPNSASFPCQLLTVADEIMSG